MQSNKIEFLQFSYLLNEAKLSQQGQAIEMRNKLHQMLAYFLQHPNQTVSKQELLDALWTHGEYREKSLSQSILELRKVLGDSATTPKFIRTVPNQGYIWIAPIAEAGLTSSYFNYKNLTWLVVSLSLLIFLSLLFWPRQQNFSFNEKDTLIVGILPFENQTTQTRYKWVEYGLSDMLATDLIQFGGIKVINPSELANSHNKKPIPQIIESENLDVLLSTKFNQEGKTQSLDYILVAKDQSQVSGEFHAEDLAFAMPVLTSEIHRKLRPDSQASLASYEWQVNAMYEYAKGQHALVEKGCELAQHYFSAAFVIDPTHYWSQLQLVFCQLELNQTQIAEKSLVPLLAIEIDDSFASLKALALAQLAINQDNKIQAMQELAKSAYQIKLANNAQWLELGRKIDRAVTK